MMQIRADEVRRGDRMEGARVVWVQPVPGHRLLLIALDPGFAASGPDSAARTRRFRPDDVVEVDERMAGAG